MSVLLAGSGINGLSQDTTQPNELKSLGILSMDSEIPDLTPQKAGDILRLEAEKLNLFEIMDKYDVKYLVEQNNINVDNCFGKICLVAAGKSLGVSTMLTGSIDLYTAGINVTLRLIDVEKGQIVRTVTKEYIREREYLQLMIELAVKELFEVETSLAIVEAIKKKPVVPDLEFEDDLPQLRSDGPRMGFTMLTGNAANILEDPRQKAGMMLRPLCSVRISI